MNDFQGRLSKKEKAIQQMRLLSKERSFKADLKDLNLKDVLDKLNEENYFKEEQDFYLVRVVDKNQIIFAVPRDKVTPRQIHNFQYSESDNEIVISSRYKNLFFPSFLIYIMPLVPIFLKWNELTTKDITLFLLMVVGISLFIIIFAFTSLNQSSKHIQRELVIRANYLLRERGYRIGI